MVAQRGLLLVGLVLLLAGCVSNRSFGTGLDDQTADIALKTTLFTNADFDTSDVDITVFEGRLMLTGSVRTEPQLRELERRAFASPTVRDVLNEVKVARKTTIRQGAADAIIDEKLGAALLADNGVLRGNYQIAVSDGAVYLLGVAQGPQELARVTGHAQAIRGVKSIVSHVIFVGDPRRYRR